MVIEAARPEYACDIAQLIRNAFPEAIRQLTIYGCHGVGQYVAAQIHARPCGTDTLYTVALDQDQVVGCVEMRRLPRELCLNYIAVASTSRVQGLGRRLLKAALEASQCHAYQMLMLDVFESNLVALNWYQRLGFRRLHSSDWLVITPQGTAEGRGGLVIGYPQAEAVQDRFGFSQFRLVTSRGDYIVGRLGAKWYRITEAEALSDSEFIATLARLDITRQILLVAQQKGGSPLKGVAEKQVTAISMSAPIGEVLVRLGDPT